MHNILKTKPQDKIFEIILFTFVNSGVGSTKQALAYVACELHMFEHRLDIIFEFLKTLVISLRLPVLYTLILMKISMLNHIPVMI
jgi:hypothetical protein